MNRHGYQSRHVNLTPGLKAAVELYLQSRPPGTLRAASAALSRQYRDGGGSGPSTDFAAYLTVRLPATYAAVNHVLAEAARLRPEFAPASLLDAGAGPGTASWAAADAWPGLNEITMLDNNRSFLALAKSLARESSMAALASAHFVEGDVSKAGGTRADAVICAYALAELPLGGIAAAIRALWSAAGDMLILVEPGTPAGFARIRTARDILLAEGAVPVAPCSHGSACPMTGGDWCHFSVRLPRSRAHMHAKAARVPFEDEKFAYLAVSRSGLPSGGARILAPPGASKAATSFKLCTAHGLDHRQIARRDGAAYKANRKRVWGDLLEE